MKDRKSILILYSRGLYDTNALALADAIRAESNDCYVIDIADDKYTNFGRSKVARGLYKFGIRNARWTYELYSKMTTKKKAPNKALKNIKADPAERTGIDKVVYSITCRYYKVKNILRRYEPDIVLCFTRSALKSAIKANEQLRMYTTKIYACLTDFGLDMRFYNRRAAGYLVQNDDIKRQLVSLGIKEENVHVTDLIARERVEHDREVIKEEIGIRNDRPNVLLMGGRYGANNIKTALSTLVDYTDNFNIIVMTGGSKTIVNVAREVAKGNYDKVFLIDGIDDITKVYSVADIVVSTPTSCICGEVLAYGKPLVLLKGCGTAEKNNAEYMINHGYALDGTQKDKLITTVSEIMLGTNEVGLGDYIEIGSVHDVAKFIVSLAEEVFEEKKIMLADERIKNSESDDEEYIIEEIDTTPTDGAIIDEYDD